MARPSKDRIVAALLERHGQTYAEELGIDLERGTPSVLACSHLHERYVHAASVARRR